MSGREGERTGLNYIGGHRRASEGGATGPRTDNQIARLHRSPSLVPSTVNDGGHHFRSEPR